jgi:glutathione S-transferase
MYRLHSFCQSGNSFKVAFMLRALGVPWEPVFVDYMAGGQTRKPEWRGEVNEMGEAPVLELENGTRMSQSGAILTWLAERHGRFGGRNEGEKYEVLRWILFDNHKFTSYFATYRFMKAFGATDPDPAVMAFLKTRIDGAFDVADKHLATRRFVVGDEPTIADMSMCAYLLYPKEESGIDVASEYPNIGAWLERVKQIPGYAHPYEVLPGERIAPKR